MAASFAGRAGLGLWLIVAAAAPCAAADEPAALKSVIEAAKKEGEITLSWGSLLGGTDGARRLEGLVNKRFGTEIRFNYTPGPSGPEIAARLAQEQAAKRPAMTDIYAVSMTAANARLFMPVDWQALVPELPSAAMKFDKRGVAYATLLIGATYNNGIIPERRRPRA